MPPAQSLNTPQEEIEPEEDLVPLKRPTKKIKVDPPIQESEQEEVEEEDYDPTHVENPDRERYHEALDDARDLPDGTRVDKDSIDKLGATQTPIKNKKVNPKISEDDEREEWGKEFQNE